MNEQTFNRVMEFCGYFEPGLKRDALYLVMVEGRSQRYASMTTGYGTGQLNAVYSRVRRELKRVETLIGGPLQ